MAGESGVIQVRAGTAVIVLVSENVDLRAKWKHPEQRQTGAAGSKNHLTIGTILPPIVSNFEQTFTAAGDPIVSVRLKI